MPRQRIGDQKSSNGSKRTTKGSHEDLSKSTSMQVGDASELLLREKKKELLQDDELEELGRVDGSSSEDERREEKSLGLAQMPPRDLANFGLLVLLYLLQGIPVGLTFGSIPFLLKARMSYSQIAIFSLSSWPYSLKLLWSPIVDAVYWPDFGRRKSWIVPIQVLTAILFIWLGSRIDGILAANDVNVYTLTFLFLLTIIFCATQDIAVDGWALTLLSKPYLSYASTAQTIGLNCGYFLSFTIFLALNSPEFSNKYFRSVPNDEVGILPLGSWMIFWGIIYFLVTAWLFFVKKEERSFGEDDNLGIRGVYGTIWNICRLPHMRTFILVLLTAKIGFNANESVTGLKLLEKGFQKEDLALAVLIDFPFQIIFGYYAAKWSSGNRPLRPWIYGFYGRLLSAVVGMVVVASYPDGGTDSPIYFWAVMFANVLNSFMSTVQFVSISAFMTSIADPVIGGTYMTLLNTFSNFGGTWPKFFVLEAVDKLTIATCSIASDGDNVRCMSEEGKHMCQELGGTCNIERDGYYYASTICVLAGTLLLLGYIRPRIRYLEGLPKKSWKLRQR